MSPQVGQLGVAYLFNKNAMFLLAGLSYMNVILVILHLPLMGKKSINHRINILVQLDQHDSALIIHEGIINLHQPLY